jgi:ech hydrogenase subunit C
VDVYVPGCAARPEAIIDGVVTGLGVLAEKRAAMAKRPAESPDFAGSEDAADVADETAAEAEAEVEAEAPGAAPADGKEKEGA